MTDYPEWYREHGGAVLGFALDRYCWVTLRRLPPFFEHRHRVVWSKTELVGEASRLEHPIAREVLSELENEDGGFELHLDGDLPAWSGVGSSSACAVGVLAAAAALNGRRPLPGELVTRAVDLERNRLGETVGDQDQVFAAVGGLNRVEFTANGREVRPLVLTYDRKRDLLDHLALYYLGAPRRASTVAADVVRSFPARSSYLGRTRQLVDEAEAVLRDERRPITDLVPLLEEAWYLKSHLAGGVTTAAINDAVSVVRGLGGAAKIMGAGGGGFLLVLIDPAAMPRIKSTLGLVEVRPGIDTLGCEVVLREKAHGA